jgi:predicted benzoate:H+ symporter BenE
MFGMLESLAKAALGVVTVPVALVADVVTMGGALTDKDEPYTASAVSGVVKNLTEAVTPKS